jgi:hypothetical protein
MTPLLVEVVVEGNGFDAPAGVWKVAVPPMATNVSGRHTPSAMASPYE